jgi:hypothetical protein
VTKIVSYRPRKSSTRVFPSKLFKFYVSRFRCCDGK